MQTGLLVRMKVAMTLVACGTMLWVSTPVPALGRALAAPGMVSFGTCVPAYEPPFAFVNLPWGWVEGLAAAGATVHAQLMRSGSVVATAAATVDAESHFKFDFQAAAHIDILPGDDVALSGGGLQATIRVVTIAGGINVDSDVVAGLVTGGAVPTAGVVCARLPADLNFVALPVYIDADGRFSADFTGQMALTYDHMAQVVYKDPNGNYVVQMLPPVGLNVRVLTTEGRVEGVTTPGSTVGVVVSDTSGIKGAATTVADQTGFYSTFLYQDGRRIALQYGDHVQVAKPGHIRDLTLTMYHVSYLLPWANRVVGTVKGLSIPSGGTQGRLDLWSDAGQHWVTQYPWIGPDGSYGADFNGVVGMTAADRIRLWVTASDGTQQAMLGWTMNTGVNIGQGLVWGYAPAGDAVTVTLYQGYAGGVPTGLIGNATVVAGSAGYFSTTVPVLSQPGTLADISPSNALVVATGSHYTRTFFIGNIDVRADNTTNAMLVMGPADSVVHLEGHHPITEAQSSEWRQVTTGPDGTASVLFTRYTLQVGDLMDLTCYNDHDGLVMHRLVTVPSERVSVPLSRLRLPIVIRSAG